MLYEDPILTVSEMLLQRSPDLAAGECASAKFVAHLVQKLQRSPDLAAGEWQADGC